MPTLKEIVDAYTAVNAAAKLYFDEQLKPRVIACQTKDEFDALRAEVSHDTCDAEGQIRELPACISVGLLLSDRWR